MAYVTNGVHASRLDRARSAALFSKHLGSTGSSGRTIPRSGTLLNVPDEELWAVRQSLAATCSCSCVNALQPAGPSNASARRASSQPHALLDPDALTMATRVASPGYKRPEPIFSNPERLAAILSST